MGGGVEESADGRTCQHSSRPPPLQQTTFITVLTGFRGQFAPHFDPPLKMAATTYEKLPLENALEDSPQVSQKTASVPPVVVIHPSPRVNWQFDMNVK